MLAGWIPGIVAIAVLVGLVALAAVYNRLVRLRQRYANAFAQIDVQLKRRYDLIPNLVETAKGYMAHERQTLEAVIEARNAAAAAATRAAADPRDGDAVRAAAAAETAVGRSLDRLVALAEAYPQLKADRTMSRLMEELVSTEDRVAFARQAFNDAAMRYNTARETFPTVLLAGRFGFEPAALFEVERPEERAAVRVSLAQ
jgi:LemA protein